MGQFGKLILRVVKGKRRRRDGSLGSRVVSRPRLARGTKGLLNLGPEVLLMSFFQMRTGYGSFPHWRCLRVGWTVVTSVLVFFFVLGSGAGLRAAPLRVTFHQSAKAVDAYDFVEVKLVVGKPDAGNPFTDVVVEGQFAREGDAPVKVDGFCDSGDGRVFRIRFMPTRAGKYSYWVKYRQDKYEARHTGTFEACAGRRRGLVRVDPEHRWHFIWEGSGEHYFWNGTTTYFLMGWDDQTIRASIGRLHKLKVNRLRVVINGRVKNGRAWYENVFPTDRFTFLLNPWGAKRSGSVENPGFDVTRFNVSYWQKFERMLSFARERDMVISVIFYVDGRRPGVDPFKKSMGNEDEQRYYRYAAARFAAFSNVMWDVTNEYQLFRNEQWAEKMGALLKKFDPYDHLTSVHGHSRFAFRKSQWADFAMYQRWDESGGYRFMLSNRLEQAKTGRIIPQVNEEYGYEDHYPVGWGGNRKSPARCADNRRRLAWEIYLAGCYQTTGERADRGTGWGPDSGGGWLNGRGDDSMVMLKGYAHIQEFFTSFEWWKTEPRPGLVGKEALCLARPGKVYAVYLPHGGSTTVSLGGGSYQSRWFNPRTGEWLPVGRASGPKWITPKAPDDADWALLLTRR